MGVHREDETVLAGGNISTVVKIGATVRRVTGSWTPMVHELLDYLHDRGYGLAPRALGIDEQGREILTFISGETVVDHPWPSWVWSDELLTSAATALSTYHKVVVGYRPPVVSSRLGTKLLGSDEIVCHNDFAPYN